MNIFIEKIYDNKKSDQKNYNFVLNDL